MPSPTPHLPPSQSLETLSSGSRTELPAALRVQRDIYALLEVMAARAGVAIAPEQWPLTELRFDSAISVYYSGEALLSIAAVDRGDGRAYGELCALVMLHLLDPPTAVAREMRSEKRDWIVTMGREFARFASENTPLARLFDGVKRDNLRPFSSHAVKALEGGNAEVIAKLLTAHRTRDVFFRLDRAINEVPHQERSTELLGRLFKSQSEHCVDLPSTYVFLRAFALKLFEASPPTHALLEAVHKIIGSMRAEADEQFQHLSRIYGPVLTNAARMKTLSESSATALAMIEDSQEWPKFFTELLRTPTAELLRRITAKS